MRVARLLRVTGAAGARQALRRLHALRARLKRSRRPRREAGRAWTRYCMAKHSSHMRPRHGAHAGRCGPASMVLQRCYFADSVAFSTSTGYL